MLNFFISNIGTIIVSLILQKERQIILRLRLCQLSFSRHMPRRKKINPAILLSESSVNAEITLKPY